MFCSNCGKEILYEGKFCVRCGNKLPEIKTVVSQQESESSEYEVQDNDVVVIKTENQNDYFGPGELAVLEAEETALQTTDEENSAPENKKKGLDMPRKIGITIIILSIIMIITVLNAGGVFDDINFSTSTNQKSVSASCEPDLICFKYNKGSTGCGTMYLKPYVGEERKIAENVKTYGYTYLEKSKKLFYNTEDGALWLYDDGFSRKICDDGYFRCASEDGKSYVYSSGDTYMLVYSNGDVRRISQGTGVAIYNIEITNDEIVYYSTDSGVFKYTRKNANECIYPERGYLSKDGKYIFISNSETYELLLYSEEKGVTSVADNVGSHAISNNGKYIAYNNQNGNVYVEKISDIGKKFSLNKKNDGTVATLAENEFVRNISDDGNYLLIKYVCDAEGYTYSLSRKTGVKSNKVDSSTEYRFDTFKNRIVDYRYGDYYMSVYFNKDFSDLENFSSNFKFLAKCDSYYWVDDEVTTVVVYDEDENAVEAINCENGRKANLMYDPQNSGYDAVHCGGDLIYEKKLNYPDISGNYVIPIYEYKEYCRQVCQWNLCFSIKDDGTFTFYDKDGENKTYHFEKDENTRTYLSLKGYSPYFDGLFFEMEYGEEINYLTIGDSKNPNYRWQRYGDEEEFFEIVDETRKDEKIEKLRELAHEYRNKGVVVSDDTIVYKYNFDSEEYELDDGSLEVVHPLENRLYKIEKGETYDVLDYNIREDNGTPSLWMQINWYFCVVIYSE